MELRQMMNPISTIDDDWHRDRAARFHYAAELFCENHPMR
jgi:hypothetical protein